MGLETISSTDMGVYVICEERWRDGSDEEWTQMKSARTKEGDYIGNPSDAKRLCDDRGILPEKSDPEDCTCSIGFCEREQKWYGWSHRAIAGFSVGDKVEAGDMCSTSGWIDGICPDGGKDPLPLPVGFEAKTLGDAKRMAIAFASSVS